MSILKDLGNLQKKIIFYLAENPKQHKETIQKKLEHKYYGAVLNAVRRLEKSGFLVSEKARSKKNVKIKLYSCSEKGVFYALIKNEKANVLKILENYKDYRVVKRLREVCDMLGEEVFVKLLRFVQPFLPLVESLNVEEACGCAVGYALKHLEKLGELKEVIEKSPRAGELARKWGL